MICVLLCEIWDSYSILADVSERWCCVVGWAVSDVSEDGSASICTVRHSKKSEFFSRKILLCLLQRRDGQDMQHVYLKKEMHLHRLGRLNANTATSTEYTRKSYYKF
jgi:hypothetical protein